ncbi:MAG: hypothetical protein PWP58_814 [Bacillota bacterium]|nr:hypothetical protein [Bacillota bacterium]
MPTGLIALIVVTVLVYFGLAQRVLDRMHLTDKQALFFLALMIVGAYVNLTLWPPPTQLVINIGGGLVPLFLAGYILSRAGTQHEWSRTALATVITAGAVYTAGRLLPAEPGTMLLDPTYVYALIAGITGYLSGRSRRGSFIAATVGVILADVIYFVRLLATGTPGRAAIGGAGAYDTVVLAGLLSVLLVEVIGETREKLAGGSEEELYEHRLRGIQATGSGRDAEHLRERTGKGEGRE